VTSPDDDDGFLSGLTDSSLYAIGAYFSDASPELVDDVLAESLDIERVGLAGWAAREDVPMDEAFQTLVTGLAVRYYKAVAGSG
jgi:hypothetical protein